MQRNFLIEIVFSQLNIDWSTWLYIYISLRNVVEVGVGVPLLASTGKINCQLPEIPLGNHVEVWAME